MGIYLAEGERLSTRAGSRVTVKSCRSVKDLDSSIGERIDCYRVIVDRLRSAGEAWVGCDFPFSVVQDAIRPQTWKEYVLSMGRRFAEADHWRQEVERRIGGEKKRQTDADTRAPWSPTNLRLYRQTFFGMAHILAPLVAGDTGVALPMMRDEEGKLKLLEVCPACRLKKVDLYKPYKGRGPTLRGARVRLVKELSAMAGMTVELAPSLARQLIDQEGGDALDAVIALLIVAGAVDERHELLHADERNQWEGFIYG
jgi:hypothetical protein